MRYRVLELPRLVSGRDFAADMVAAFVARDGDLAGARVVVDASGVLHGSESFASELVTRILIQRRAADLVVVDAPGPFTDAASRTARDLGVTDRFAVVESAHRPTAG